MILGLKFLNYILVICFTTWYSYAQEHMRVKVKTPEVKNFDVSKGIYDVSLQTTDGLNWQVKISIPKIETNTKYPLILALHWAGGSETYKEFNDCLVSPAIRDFNAIVISPSSNGGHWVNDYNEYKVIDLVNKIKKYWPVNDKQIIVTGYSNGAIGSWEYAKKYPKLFSAAIAISGYYTTAKLKVPVYVIHGAKDELFNKNEVAIAIQNSRKKGSKIDFEILPGLSHYMGCFYSEALKRKLHKIKSEIWIE